MEKVKPWRLVKLWKQDNQFNLRDMLHYHQPARTLRSSSQLLYSVSRRQGSTSNPRHSASRHQLSGTLCLQLRKVPLPPSLSRHIWKLNCSLLHTTRSNISSAAGTSDSNSRLYTAPPMFLTLPLTLIEEGVADILSRNPCVDCGNHFILGVAWMWLEVHCSINAPEFELTTDKNNFWPLRGGTRFSAMAQ